MKNILILFLFCYTSVYTQTSPQLSIDSTRVDAKLIVGFWESSDSKKYRIEFIDEQWAVKLKADVGVAGGYFFSKDSLNRITMNGYAPNWPPYDCGLKLISIDTLEIATRCFMCEAIKSKFVRVREK